jgi:hypothetical protein
VYNPASVVDSNVGDLHASLDHGEPEFDGVQDAQEPSTSSPVSLTDEPTHYPSQSPIQALDDNDVQYNGSSLDSSDVKELQISNYIDGNALILNIHITHHAGTSVCSTMSKMGPTPSFACMKQRSGDDTPWPENDPNINRFSMTYEDPVTLVDVFRPYFHFMSIEYPRFGNLHKANWEYENLVSMIVMRNPLDRFLAGGKCGRFHHTAINEADPDPESEEIQQLYWEYANADCANNYALRVLADREKCDETNMDECFESAKTLLKRFTFILDEDCLDESMEAVGAELNLNVTTESFTNKFHHEHQAARDRINNATLYEFLMDKFHYDIQLYEWSKSASIVKCDDLDKYD